MRRSRLLTQPLTGTMVMATALTALAIAYLRSPESHTMNGVGIQTLALALALTCTHVLGQCLPIHIHANTKIQLASVPVYLMAVLLPVPLAVSAALIGFTVGEGILGISRGAFWSDIASQVGRLSLITLLASLCAHISTSGIIASTGTLIGAGVILWVGDILTSFLAISPITGESPRHVIVTVLRQAGFLEAVQYGVGILGVVVVQHAVWTLSLLAVPMVLVYMSGKRSKELQNNTRMLLENMADAVDLRDPYTGGHSRRVTEYTMGILNEIQMHGPDMALIEAAARVHDIGKIGIPDAVLLKPDRLTDDEMAIMQTHPARGADLLNRYPDFSRGTEIVRHHHERLDGKGYPDGLRGADIPFGARVIAVADSYDAMTSDRPYRPGMSSDTAARILREGRGTQWEDTLVDAFLRTVGATVSEPVPMPVQIAPPARAEKVS